MDAGDREIVCKREGEQKGSARGSVHWRSLLNLKSRMASPTASAAFAVPLPVLVVNDRDGVKHRGTLQLPRRAPAAAPGRPSSADLARLRPLMLLCDLCQRCVQEMFERRVQYKILACWY